MEIAGISLYDIIVHFFAVIGFGAVITGWYYFFKDQYKIWEINTYVRLKKKFDW